MAGKEIVINKLSIAFFVLAVITMILVFGVPYEFTPNTKTTLYDADKFCSSELFGTSISEISTRLGNDTCSTIHTKLIMGIILLIAFLIGGVYFLFNEELPKLRFK